MFEVTVRLISISDRELRRPLVGLRAGVVVSINETRRRQQLTADRLLLLTQTVTGRATNAAKSRVTAASAF